MNYANVKTLMFCALVGAAGIVTAQGASAQTPLTEWPKPNEIAKPCQYFEDGVEKLEWAGRSQKENRLQFFWSLRNKPGQTGQCNHLKGFADSCERVSWVARVRTRRDIGGWLYPNTVQAVYHFKGGVDPSDFCTS